MKIYDDIDIRNEFSRGYWIGTVAGAVSMFLLCLGLGLFLNS